MKPLEVGMIVTELEGMDLGPDGAVVVDSYDGVVDLLRLDTEELLEGVELEADSYHAQEAPHTEPVLPWGYDPSALNSPELHDIRRLPTYWGPRDPNNPSSLTDTIWRPEPLWRRYMNRYYARTQRRDHTMSDRRRRPQRRHADPLPSMNPVPKRVNPASDRRIKPYKGLPRPMHVYRWEPGKDDVFDTEALIAHTLDFWKQYREKRITYSPEIGDRKSLTLSDWALMYQAQEGLSRDEMDLLYRFMVATELIPQTEYTDWQDVLDTYQVHRYHRR